MPAHVPAAARTLAIFEAFAREQRELSNSELARHLGVAESSCSDLLHTLLETGYLMRTARTRRFYPSGRLFEITRQIARNDPLLRLGKEAVDMLSERTGETALCGRLEGGHVSVIAMHEGKHALRYVVKVGTRIGLHVTALGKALLAALPRDEAARQLRLRPLKQYTEHSITDLARLERELDRIRKRGLATVSGEGTDGVSAMAVAGVFGSEPLAISLAGASERFRRHEATYREALLEVRAMVFQAPAGAPDRTAEQPASS
ncbi:MAG: IclR family transcriptional regulator [Burkholderiaceae bacterium]|nr:IclR family transcriptional regulator [Burkholderiaceae bacterium]